MRRKEKRRFHSSVADRSRMRRYDRSPTMEGQCNGILDGILAFFHGIEGNENEFNMRVAHKLPVGQMLSLLQNNGAELEPLTSEFGNVRREFESFRTRPTNRRGRNADRCQFSFQF